MSKFNIAVIGLCLLTFFCLGVLFFKVEKENPSIIAEIETKVKIRQSVEENFNIPGVFELEGVLDNSLGNLILITVDQGDIFIISNESEKKELSKLIGSEIMIKGKVEKKNNKVEIKMENFYVIEDVSDKPNDTYE